MNDERCGHDRQLAIERGEQVIVVSGLQLGVTSNEHSAAIAAGLARRIDAFRGPGTLILAGDTFDLAGQPLNSARRALVAHPALLAALERFGAAPEHRVVTLAGAADARLSDPGHDRPAVLGLPAGTVHLHIDTGGGTRRVDVVASTETASPEESAAARWARFYERASRRCWLPLAGPVVLMVGVRLALLVAGRHHHVRSPLLGVMYLLCSIITLQLVATSALLWRLRSGDPSLDGPPDANRHARARASALVAGGVDGVIAGSTGSAELVDFGEGWFATPGPSRRLLTRRRSRFGLPAVYTPSSCLSWIVLEAGAELHVHLVASQRDDCPGLRLERMVTPARSTMPATPMEVARLVRHVVWPLPFDPARATDDIRRHAALIIAACGVIDIVSAVTPPLRARLHLISDITPVGTPQAAAGFVLVAGIALVLLARGLRRGRQTAMHLAVATLALTVVGHLVKGVDVEEAALSTLVTTWLVGHARSFGAVGPSPMGSNRRRGADGAATTARAWELVRRHGRGTLDYFSLRDDKRHLIVEDTVVAYAVLHGTAVVAPDPIGPADQRARAWNAFRSFAATNGWRVAVVGATEAWLSVYRAGDMVTMYIGDEAVVDTRRFCLDGGRNKSLRQAVNRIAAAGYTFEVADPAHLDAATHFDLAELASTSRRGHTERGFSMTLSRLCDPRDVGLLLTIVRGPDGRAAAFCQFTPAPAINGYSLDVMRRDDPHADIATARGESEMGRHPNGLMEFLIVRTIEHLRAEGRTGLGLHFVTMRAVLDGDTDGRVRHRVIAALMRYCSDTMQIESLWRFNSRFEPDWSPRYVVIDRVGSMLPAALAISRLESLWELPLIGPRLLRQRSPVGHDQGEGSSTTSTPSTVMT